MLCYTTSNESVMFDDWCDASSSGPLSDMQTDRNNRRRRRVGEPDTEPERDARRAGKQKKKNGRGGRNADRISICMKVKGRKICGRR